MTYSVIDISHFFGLDVQ